MTLQRHLGLYARRSLKSIFGTFHVDTKIEHLLPHSGYLCIYQITQLALSAIAPAI